MPEGETQPIVPDFQTTPSLEQLWAAVRALEDSLRYHKHTGYDLSSKVLYRDLRRAVRVYSSNFASVDSSGTALQTLRSFNLQGGDMGPNGMLEISAWFSSNNVDANRPQLDIAGTAVGVLGRIRARGICIWRIFARNSEASQLTMGLYRANDTEIGPFVNTVDTTSTDLTATRTIAIRCQPDTTEVLTLQAYAAILYPSIT